MCKKIELLDFLRGFAIFTIVLMHLLMKAHIEGVFSKVIALGGAGVHVFILVSGFGLYLSYLRKPLTYTNFLKKRFSKVYWPYAVVVFLWGIWLYFKSADHILPWRDMLSHLLLYKMFDPTLDVSLCYPFWFISTIIQFYLFWPLIVHIARIGNPANKITWKGVLLGLFISLSWATTVGAFGYEELRPWGSCFLQYLWEFVLGMYLAERYTNDKVFSDNSSFIIDHIKWIWLLGGIIVGFGLTGIMGWKGGILKLYNDIPSLIGYISGLLLLYKMAISYVNKFFMWASSFGYELYLIHSLVFSIITFITKNYLPIYAQLIICFSMAYIIAYAYHQLIILITRKKHGHH